MKEPKKHLDVDLDFLDEKEPVRIASKSESETSIESQYNWKKILLISGIVLFFFWAIFSDSETNVASSNTSSSTSASVKENFEEMVINGEFMCTSFHDSQADKLGPTSSEESSIESLSSSINSLEESIDREKSSLESTYVDEYSEYSVNSYNSRLDALSRKIDQYNNKLDEFDRKRGPYNIKVEAYNNYLIANCTKR